MRCPGMAKIHLKNVIFSFTPIKMKLYTMKVPMKSNIFCITNFFENVFKYANELYTNRICPKYTQIGFIFSFTTTTIKLYIVKVYMKSNFFVLQVSFEINLNMHMSSTLIEYFLICIGRNTIPLAGTTKPGSFQVRAQSKSSIAITHWQSGRG